MERLFVYFGQVPLRLPVSLQQLATYAVLLSPNKPKIPLYMHDL